MRTTESLEATQLKSKEAGAKAWMVKPFTPKQIINAVHKLSI